MRMRMNISIPANLKQCMDAINEPTNWSAIASDAFRIHLHKLAKTKTKLNMTEIIDRLKASQKITDNEGLTAGERAGRDWAARKAEAIHLRRLKEARHPVEDWYFGVGSSAYSAAEVFYFIIEPKFDGERTAAADFWETVTGEREAPETAYVNGFASGAMDIWDQVEDQM